MDFVSFFGPWVAPQVAIPIVVLVAFLSIRRYFRSEERMKKADKAKELHEGLNLWVNDGGGEQIRRIFREEFATSIQAHEKIEKTEREADRAELRRELVEALAHLKTDDRVYVMIEAIGQRLTVVEKIIERRKR